jgi:hypothetical protein
MRIVYKARIRFTNTGGNQSAANANQAAQASFYNTLTANYQATYGKWTALTNSLNAAIQPIIAAGPGQYGYTPAENASLNAGVVNTAAGNYANQSVAQANNVAAMTGGTGMPSGAEAELDQNLAIKQAQGVSTGENAVTQAGYTQGNANYQTALGQESGLIADYNPNSAAASTTGGGTAATGAVNAATAADTAASAGVLALTGSALGGTASVLTGAVSK